MSLRSVPRNSAQFHCSCGVSIKVEGPEEALRFVSDVKRVHLDMGHDPVSPQMASAARRRAALAPEVTEA